MSAKSDKPIPPADAAGCRRRLKFWSKPHGLNVDMRSEVARSIGPLEELYSEPKLLYWAPEPHPRACLRILIDEDDPRLLQGLLDPRHGLCRTR